MPLDAQTTAAAAQRIRGKFKAYGDVDDSTLVAAYRKKNLPAVPDSEFAARVSRRAAPNVGFQAASADVLGRGPGTEGGAGGAVNATAGALGRAASYPANLLFQELPERFDRALGSYVQEVTDQGTAFPSPLRGPAATAAAAKAAWLNQGPTAAEQFAGMQDRGVTEGYLGPGLAAGINAATRSPAGSVADFASSPAGQGLALNIAAGELLNPIGAGAAIPIKAIGRSRLANKARGLPGVSRVGDFFSRGFSITNPAQRAALRGSIEQRLGEEALENARLAEETALRTDFLKRITARTGEDPLVAQERIRTALEEVPRTAGRSFRGLQSDERKLAASLEAQARQAPGAMAAARLEPWELERGPGNVAYRPRVARTKFQEAIGEARGDEPIVFRGGPKGISTSPGHGRVTDPTKTSSQVEAEISASVPGMAGEKAFRPEIEASLLAGQRTNRTIANAKIVTDAMKYAGTRFQKGGFVPKGMVRADQLIGAKTGLDVATTAALETTALPKSVFHALDDYSKAVAQQKGLPVLGSFNRYFKTTATSINPRFTIRNAEWNGIIGFVRGNRDPRNFATASTALAKTNELGKVPGLKLRYAQLRDELISNRVVGTGFATEGLPGKALSDASRANKILGAVPRAMGKVNQEQEDLFRAAYYIAKRRAGMSAKDAATDVRHTYFNYARDAFTAGEGAIRRNLVPFYSWQRRILPLTLRSVAETPAAFPQIGTSISTVSLWNGMSPEEVQYLGPDMLQSLGVALPAYPGQTEGERRVMSLSAVGMSGDINALVGTRGRGAYGPIDNLLGSTTPAVGKLLGLATKRDFYRGRVLDGSPVELPHYLKPLIQAAPKLAEKLSMRIENGRVVGTDFTREILTIPGPFPSAMSDLRAASIGDKNALRRAIAWATSVNTSVRDLQTGRDFAEGKEATVEREAVRKERKVGYLKDRFEREDELNQRIGGAQP